MFSYQNKPKIIKNSQETSKLWSNNYSTHNVPYIWLFYFITRHRYMTIHSLHLKVLVIIGCNWFQLVTTSYNWSLVANGCNQLWPVAVAVVDNWLVLQPVAVAVAPNMVHNCNPTGPSKTSSIHAVDTSERLWRGRKDGQEPRWYSSVGDTGWPEQATCKP
jgi:hypothetical protein